MRGKERRRISGIDGQLLQRPPLDQQPGRACRVAAHVGRFAQVNPIDPFDRAAVGREAGVTLDGEQRGRRAGRDRRVHEVRTLQ